MDYTAILILACVFIPLERLLPLHPDQPMLRRDWKNDLFYMLFNGFVVRAGFAAVAGAVMIAYGAAFGANPFPAIAAMPLWLQVICVLIVSDIGYYTAHRICHAVPFLWQFHSVHHSVEEMDWLATHRVHPVDQVFSTLLSMLPVFFLGFSVQALVISQLLFHAHSLLLHSNTRITFGPLKWVFASPEYHHRHHANERDAYDRNFAGQLSIIDAIAGTLFLPARRKPVAYGLNDPMPRLYHHADQIPLWGLALTAQLVGTVFLVFILYFTLVRLPPRESASGIMPRLIAILGTYIMMTLVLLPPDPISAEMRVISTLMIIAGSLLSIACLLQLGKTFSIMATSRALKTTGAYGIVRHPLYGAEVLMILGVVLSHGSFLAFGVGALWLTLQIRRAQFEESVLRQSFPAYEAYAARVPMLIPGLRVAAPEATPATPAPDAP